ncbi:YeiH family protein [Xinfangfangia pollutisoli]|uniref:YeiH family protein n=1 Tax=Xinfangfangia pollutisoli TaxID=2865960 RepID=UPI001CD62436|nr:YeiH family protein [Xinfangfangia pollutisoli]
MPLLMHATFHAVSTSVSRLFRGVFVALLIAGAATFLSDHYGAPAMLMALLLGIALNFLSEEPQCAPGIAFASRTVLRFGVALLGLRISWQMLAGLGASSVLWIMAAVATTIAVGLLGARLLGRDWRFGMLTGGSVAICGASAAMAISAVLPRNERSDTDLSFTVMAVTLLSTIAMVIYPIFTDAADMPPADAGLFLGATIHDVAQVVGAGYTVSDETGDVATAVKLLRVACLAPVILLLGVAIGRSGQGSGQAGAPGARRPPLLPFFVLAFLLLTTLNSLVAAPPALVQFAGELSKWMLLTAVAAVGMKTSLRQLAQVGGPAVILVVAETAYLGIGFFLITA